MRVPDRAIPVFGATGLSQDFHLVAICACMRVLRIGDGPDEVHLSAIAKIEFERFGKA